MEVLTRTFEEELREKMIQAKKECKYNLSLIHISDYAPQPYLEILGDDLINLGKPDGVETTLDLVTEPGFKAVERCV